MDRKLLFYCDKDRPIIQSVCLDQASPDVGHGDKQQHIYKRRHEVIIEDFIDLAGPEGIKKSSYRIGKASITAALRYLIKEKTQLLQNKQTDTERLDTVTRLMELFIFAARANSEVTVHSFASKKQQKMSK